VIVTSDNPRTEDPGTIIQEILAGIADPERTQAEADRHQAIAHALSIAQPGDAVLIAGKGHETYQIIGKEKRHFDDREEVEQWIRGAIV
jgi:UDP-N-acetylmuramoyl-L-alanyl-D-glutamate--2,6-diaminopimelate ligase